MSSLYQRNENNFVDIYLKDLRMEMVSTKIKSLYSILYISFFYQ